MGIHVQLAVFAERVSDGVWETIYEKARRVATPWTPRPLASAWHHIGVVRVAQYTLEIETPDGLHLVGDAETLTAAESFVFQPGSIVVAAGRFQGLAVFSSSHIPG